MNNVIKLLIISLCLNADNCFAFNETITHPDLTRRAFLEKSSGLNLYLIGQLGFQSGIGTNFNQKNMLQWFQEGSIEEDIPVCRAANHFHNPLLAWDQSYSTDVWPQDQICQADGWTPRYSNIFWATGYLSPDDVLTNKPVKPRNRQDMGWDHARNYFYNALTATNTTTRETMFAKTFQAVGQTLHLLQDMAVPAHVRNDFLSHLIYSEITQDNISNPSDWVGNPFEIYVRNNPSLITSITQIPTYTINSAIVTDFWDTDNRSGASITGLAESTNSGYLSDFTIPGNPHVPFVSSHDFPSPQIPEYTCSDTIPGTNRQRKYASKEPCPTDGSSIKHVAALSMFTPRLLGAPPLPVPFFNKYALDDNVHKTYANDLLPRAIGYSASLLDYFFRGTIQISLPPQGVYATAASNGNFNEIHVKAKNTTVTGEDMSNGTIQLVVKYNLSLADPFQSVLVDLGPDTYIVIPEKTSGFADNERIKRIPRGTEDPVELTFVLPANALTAWAANVSLQVVYKGQLGNESNSVAVGFSDISEPTPVDVYNNTDYSCLNNTWYRYDDPAAMAIVDTSVPPDGKADLSDIYPHDINNISFLGGPATAGTLNAAASNNLFAAGPLHPGQFLRMGYILTDYANSYAFNEIRTGLNGDPFSHATVNNKFFPNGEGFRNDWDIQTTMFSFRGINMWSGVGTVFINTEYNGTCTWDALNQKLGY